MVPESTLIPDFPDEARVWIYAAQRPVTPDEADRLIRDLAPFLASWTSHRRAVRGAATVLEDRFLVLAATAPDGDLSGCGIDKSVHHVEAAGRSHGLSWAPALDVTWRDGTGTVRLMPRPEFRRAVADGTIDADTPVFDLTVDTLGALRNGGFERRAADSWHARVFGIGESAT